VADGNYNLEQLYNLALQAGWSPEWAPYAAATAMVESSGDPRAASGTGPVGLWQINRGNAQRLGYSLDDRLDPLKNATMALMLWNDRGGTNVSPERAFADWWPYDRNTGPKNDTFNKYLAQAKGFSPNPSILDQIGKTLGNGVDALKNGADALNPLAAVGKIADQFVSFAKMMAWFINPANDIRVLFGMFGIGFLLLGVLMLGREVRRG